MSHYSSRNSERRQSSGTGDTEANTSSVDEGAERDGHGDNGVSEDLLESRLFMFTHLDRKLERPHITGIAFSGTVGIGLFITSGQEIAISGSLGCVLGYVIASLIIVGVMRSLAEMVSVRPVFSALIDYPHTFVDPALGFAVGASYCIAECISMAALTSAAARVANNFHPTGALAKGQTAGIIVGLCIITLLSNACGVRIYGNLERFFKWIKMLTIVALCILMIMINVGNYGYPETNRARNMTQYGLVPYLNFNGHTTHIKRESPEYLGIPGASGQFLSIWTSITFAVFACMGGDIVIISAGEAKTPRRDLPAAARFMYLVPLSCYVLGSFLVGLNINYKDPLLYNPLSNPTPDYQLFESHSPYIIVLSLSSLAPKILPSLFSALFLFSAYTAANTALYVSSRTLFALTRLYGNKALKDTVGRTNQGHTPLTAIMLCSLFSGLAFLGLADDTFNQPILSLSAFFTGTIACVYCAECLAFLRFKRGHDRRRREGLLCRDDEKYKSKHYRAHWQPLWAIVGFIGCALIMIFSGWPQIYIMSQRRRLTHGAKLKPDRYLAWDVVGAYSGPVLFFLFYSGYKMIFRTKMATYVDFRRKYVLAEFDDNEEDLPDETRQTGWAYYLKEVWSFIK